jgi:hypothetical protein
MRLFCAAATDNKKPDRSCTPAGFFSKRCVAQKLNCKANWAFQAFWPDEP